MRIAVFGAGAVGSYFGGRLAEVGEDVTFIARGKTLEALKKNGLKVESIAGDFHLQPVQVAASPAELGVVDVVLVAVKAWQVPEAAEVIKPMVGTQTMVVPLQNGVEAPAQLAAVLGNDAVLGGMCGIISFVAEPGHIKHIGAEPFIHFGERDKTPSERSQRLLQAFQKTKGVNAVASPDIDVSMWRKFLLIASWSGVGSVTRVPIGIIRTLPETRALLEGTMLEILAVGRARGIALPDSVIADTWTFFDGLSDQSTASMQRDVMEGHPSELESQTGAVVRMAQAAGVEVPLNTFIYHSLLALEYKARGKLSI